ncbi:hypothetical protein ACE6H2_015093 [Prunus campanulata]
MALKGQLPSDIELLSELEILIFDRNNLTGSIPSTLGLVQSLQAVDMSNNTFDDSDVPSWFSTLQNLTTLYVSFLNDGKHGTSGRSSSSSIQQLQFGDTVSILLISNSTTLNFMNLSGFDFEHGLCSKEENVKQGL